ncbi:X-linked retinitis pigmentosa GTPase regulator-interacting protein 1 [Chionoecetes opilio]|uniref:X-linked retinitis pigmentosa GTPase regulator-interacting protein 1 n=1 Tax=Chionoecetes opilio TaxID=41210 RepID=A0A8J4XRK2_CHIOP|nr:X-linked retinitis pigmentosa GTPase regulator-interacting protein 1 [Chionoecetes opilio]
MGCRVLISGSYDVSRSQFSSEDSADTSPDDDGSSDESASQSPQDTQTQKVSNQFDVLGALGDPVELWDTFKRETLQAAKECIGERPRSRRGFVSTETLEKIEESRAARLAGNRDQHRALSRQTRTLLRRDKERYVRSLAEDVEGHLNANDLRPAYRALKKLRSKSPSRASAIRTADGRLVSDMDGQMARWAEYFGQLFTVDPPTEQLHTTGLQAVDADPPIDETAPSLDEVREAVAKLKGGKAAGVCNISAELLKAGGEAMIRGLHAVLTAVWQSVIFAESLEVLVMALEALHEEAKPLGLEVSWLKTKVQSNKSTTEIKAQHVPIRKRGTSSCDGSKQESEKQSSSECNHSSDSEGVVAVVSKTRKNNHSRIYVQVTSITLLQDCGVLQDPMVELIFVDYHGFLGLPPDQLETPVSLPKNAQGNILNFNFGQEFSVDKKQHPTRVQALTELMGGRGILKFTITSEPSEEMQDTHDCQDLGSDGGSENKPDRSDVQLRACLACRSAESGFVVLSVNTLTDKYAYVDLHHMAREKQDMLDGLLAVESAEDGSQIGVLKVTLRIVKSLEYLGLV